MLDVYLNLEPNVSCNHIIKINLLDPLLENCHNPQISTILLNLLEPFTSKYNIFGQTQVHIWNFCLETGFFERIIGFIIKEKGEIPDVPPEEEAKTAINILENAEKYYSQQKTQLIKMAMVKKLGGIGSFLNNFVGSMNSTDQKMVFTEGNLDKILGPLPSGSEAFLKENIKIEEFTGKSPDIDYLKGFLKSNTAIKPIEISHKTIEISDKSSEKFNKDPEKFKETGQIQFETDILRFTTSSLDIEKGFTSSKLITLYPTRFLFEHIAKLDNIANKPDYQMNNLKESEKRAFPASLLINTVLSMIIEYQDNDERVEFLKIKRTEGASAMIEMFFHKSGSNFEKILMVKIEFF